MTRKHLNIEQIDGNDTFVSEDLEEDDKYSGTCHYWKTGRLSTVYQTFLDANAIIDHSNLTEERKSIEKKSFGCKEISFWVKLQPCPSLESEAVKTFSSFSSPAVFSGISCSANNQIWSSPYIICTSPFM